MPLTHLKAKVALIPSQCSRAGPSHSAKSGAASGIDNAG